MTYKKILFKSSYILLSLVLLCLFFFPIAKADDEIVVFESSSLKSAIASIIGKEEITISDMENISGKLDLSYSDITSIKGLEFLTNVDELILSYNYITDISPIIELDSLESLYIDNNWIKELPDIKTKLLSLIHLDMSDNKIAYIPSQFLDFPSLRRLYISNLSLSSPPDFSKIVNTLDRLDISGTRFGSLESVEKLINLELLIMNECLLDVLPDLSAMTKLQYLYFSDNNIEELPEYLGELPLIRLDFSYNMISFMPESFMNLKKLEQLVFTGNYFTYLQDVVTNMKSLEVLMCSQNIISDITDNISDLENIKRASFASNELTSLEKFIDFNIPYSYQISFNLNYLDLDDEINQKVLKKYHNTGGVQKEIRLKANVLSADTDSVIIECEFDMSTLDSDMQIKNISVFNYDEDKLSSLTSEVFDIVGNKFNILLTNQREGILNYLVIVEIEDISWPPKIIKYTNILENIKVL